MRVPSGEKSGRASFAECATRMRAAPPDEGTVHTSPPETKAISAPSGEIPGSASDGSAPSPTCETTGSAGASATSATSSARGEDGTARELARIGASALGFGIVGNRRPPDGLRARASLVLRVGGPLGKARGACGLRAPEGSPAARPPSS